ncbi:MAG TPA: adenylate/guanylate cyclase domain-containing protein [Acidimicrobiia bacterium]|nr:adenylate/guanylate cyclase domain-containing protein [Acidimicrobiia bacterium]
MSAASREDTSGGRSVRRKSLDRPDETRRFPNGIGTLVDIGPLAIGRAILEPGWRWSTDLKQAVGTELCQLHHLHVLVAGRMAFQMADGKVHEFAPGDVMDIPPGHDAWVVGEEPVVVFDISGNVTDFGLPTSRARAVATMLMTDIVGSTKTAAEIGDAAWKQRLGEHNRAVRRQIERFHGREIKTTGDGFLVVFDSAEAALLSALAIRDVMRDLGIEIRTGVHTGEVEVLSDDIRGIAVHAAARIMAAAQPSEVLASAVTRYLAEGTALGFEDRGAQALKGIETPLQLFAVQKPRRSTE